MNRIPHFSRLVLTLLLATTAACSQPPPAPDLPEPGAVSPRRTQ